ncbi:hypothetical protein P9112_004261 [Eukaryota sp. TZLM1-RC]
MSNIQRESLFGESSSTSRKRKAPRPTTLTKKSNPSPSYKSNTALYPAGTQSLGLVTRVAPNFLFLTLPGDVTAYVNVSNVSDELNEVLEADPNCSLVDFFSIGDVVLGVVLQAGHRPVLSLVPSAVNYSLADSEIDSSTPVSIVVKSEEDHGWLCSTGLDLPAFLPLQGNSQLKIGKVHVAYVVKSSPRHLQVSIPLKLEVPNISVDIKELAKRAEALADQAEEKPLKKIIKRDNLINSTKLYSKVPIKSANNAGIQLLLPTGEVFLYKTHLSDFCSHNDAILEFIKTVLNKIDQLKVAARTGTVYFPKKMIKLMNELGLEVDNFILKAGHVLTLHYPGFFSFPTMKRSVIEDFINNLYPDSPLKLSPHQEFFGFVKKVFENKVIVGFPNNLTGLLRTEKGNQFVTDQSIRVRVKSVNSEGKFLLSFAQSIKCDSLFHSLATLHTMEPTLTLPQLPQPGTLIEAVPVQETEFGLVLSLVTGGREQPTTSEDVTIVVPKDHFIATEESPVWVRVLSVKAKIGLVEATMKPELVGSVPSREKSLETRGKFKKQKSSLVKQDDDVMGSIIHVSNDSIIFSFSQEESRRPLFILVPCPLVSAGLMSNTTEFDELVKVFPIGFQTSIKIKSIGKDGSIIGQVKECLADMIEESQKGKSVADFSLNYHELSEDVKQSIDDLSSQKHDHTGNLTVGQRVSAVISSLSNGFYYLSLSPTTHGKLLHVDCGHSRDSVLEFVSNARVGDLVTAFITSIDNGLMFSLVDQPLIKDVVTVCRIESKFKTFGRLVQLPGNRKGVVHPCDVSDDLTRVGEGFGEGEVAECKIVDVCGDVVKVSLKESDFSDSAAKPITVDDLIVGQELQGLVVGQSESGLFVDISREFTGRVRSSQVSGKVLIGDVIKVYVLSILDKKASLSMKSFAKKSAPLTPKDQGKVLDCTVKNVQNFGLFLAAGLHNKTFNMRSLPTVFVHKSKVFDKGNEVDLENRFSIGDHVKVLIKHVDENKNRVFGSMRSSDIGVVLEEEKEFKLDDVMVGESNDEGQNDDVDQGFNEPSDSDSDSELDRVDVVNMDDSDDEIVDLNLDEVSDEEVVDPFMTSSTPISSKLTENEVRKTEDLLVTGSNANSTADIERELLANPTSPPLWIQLAALSLAEADIEKTRDTFDRAVDAMKESFGKDLGDIWAAYLNFENNYGSQSTLENVFERMKMVVEPSIAHLSFCKCLIGKVSQIPLETIVEALSEAVKKCQTLIDFWVLYYEFSREMEDQLDSEHSPNAVIKRALFFLPSRYHVDFSRIIAQKEFKSGNQQKGRSLFEKLVSNHPKRADLWSVYLDMEISHGSVEFARQLFHRLTTVKFSSKAIRNLFRKWAKFEAQHGTNEQQAFVETSARKYLEKFN